MTDPLYIVLLLILIGLAFGLGIFLGYYVFKNSFLGTESFANKHKNYLELYNHFLDLAYDKIYSEQLVTFSSEGISPSEEEFESIQREYVKLCISAMGPNIESALSKFYGTNDTLVLNILLYFKSRYSNDELMDYIRQKKSTGLDNA